MAFKRSSQPGHGPRHANRRRPDQVTAALNCRPVKPVSISPPGQLIAGGIRTRPRIDIEIQCLDLPAGGRVQQEPATADTGQPWLDDRKHQHRDHCRIHRIAPALQHAGARPRGFVVLRNDDPAGGTHLRFLYRPGLR